MGMLSARVSALPSAEKHGCSRAGARRRKTAAMLTLIETAKLNGIDAKAWLADVLARIADRIADLAALLPWNWKSGPAKLAV